MAALRSNCFIFRASLHLRTISTFQAIYKPCMEYLLGILESSRSESFEKPHLYISNAFPNVSLALLLMLAKPKLIANGPVTTIPIVISFFFLLPFLFSKHGSDLWNFVKKKPSCYCFKCQKWMSAATVAWRSNFRVEAIIEMCGSGNTSLHSVCWQTQI